MDNNTKLQMFIDAVNSEIDGKVKNILAEAENMKESVIAEANAYQPEADAENNGISAVKDRSSYVKDISKAELEMKKAVLRHREELTEKVFEAVKKRLSEFRDDPKYVKLLTEYLKKTDIPDGAEIFLSPSDMKHTGALEKAVPAGGIKFSPDENIRLGGLSVYDASKGTITDITFDSALEEQRRAFAEGNSFAQT